MSRPWLQGKAREAGLSPSVAPSTKPQPEVAQTESDVLFVWVLFICFVSCFFFPFSSEVFLNGSVLSAVTSGRQGSRPGPAATVRTGEGGWPCPNSHHSPASHRIRAAATLRRGSAPGGSHAGGRRGSPRPRAVLVGQQLSLRAVRELGWGCQGNGGGSSWTRERCWVLREPCPAAWGNRQACRQGEKKGKVARRAGAKPAPRRAPLARPSPPQGPAGQRELALLPRSCVAFPVPAGVPRNGRWEGRLCGFSCENTSGNSEFLTVKN